MKPLITLLIWLILSVPIDSVAQDSRQEVIWYGYFLTIPMSEKWHNVTEIQERHLIRPFQQSQFLIRTRFHSTWSAHWDTSVGISTFFHKGSQQLLRFKPVATAKFHDIKFALKVEFLEYFV